jgi:glycosyltransferase involved in cell wall biosynthesis
MRADRDPGPGVVFFLPARDEEATVADVVRRTPAQVCGRTVRVLVVDDGSVDATAVRAAAAGAEVVRTGRGSGLGAAVRTGLAEACRRGAAVVAFADADGEYAPEELELLVRPILEGRADVVAGDRFGGVRLSMRPHRAAGNRLLSRLLSVPAGRRIRDGQSGFRALSAEAAAAAEIIHDYNYAQVLTLNLLGKGFRYLEVPISYRSRRHGRSFVRLPTYLRRVVPAVWRELRHR